MFSPARSSLIPTIVGQPQLVRANAMINGLGMIVTMCSVVLSGYLADRCQPAFVFRIDGMTFVGSAVLLMLMAGVNHHHLHVGSEAPERSAARPTVRAPGASPVTQGTFRSLHGEIVTGFKYVLSHRRVVRLIVLAVIFWSCGATVRSVAPAIVKDVYGGSFQQIGLFQLWLGLGLVTGSGLLTLLGRSARSSHAITVGYLGAGVGALLLALTVLVPLPRALAHVVGGVAVYVMGTFGAGITIGYNTLLQRIVPNQYRGRVFGVLDLATQAGLLAATGLLAIPTWPGLDRWAGWIALVVALVMLGVGAGSSVIQLRSTPYPPVLGFVLGLNAFLVRFWYRLEGVGRCTVPRTGPVILTSNHICAADPITLCAACPHRAPAFLVAKEFVNLPFARHFLPMIECIPVRREERDIEATKAAIRRLRDGKMLAIFIEGRIAPPGTSEPPKEGVAVLALRTGAAVVPAHISGNVYSGGILREMFARHRTRIRFGPPVDLSAFASTAAGRPDVRAATEKIYAAIMSLAPTTAPTTNEATTSPVRPA